MADQSWQAATDLDSDQWRLLSELMGRFDTAARSNASTALSAFLPPRASPIRRQVLAELIKVAQEYAWRSGDQRPLESYLEEWPEISHNASAVAELLEAECFMRGMLGMAPAPAELQARFPDLAAAIDLPALAVEAERERVNPPTSPPDTPPLGDPVADSLPSQLGPPSLAPGQLFADRYTILDVLGTGGMGTVYRVRDEKLGVERALKVVREAHDPVVSNRFVAEARAIARIEHANVCAIHDCAESGGVHYITMPLIRGTTLAKCAADGGFDQRRTAELLVKITSALAAVHASAIIHRDIKPANIMLTESDEPVLMDFGLARNLMASVRQSQSGQWMGTLPYMSPELIDGKEADARSDIFSLGVVMYEMLTGSRPFGGEFPQMFAAIAKCRPAPPSGLRAKLSPALEAICLKAMARDPADRFQSAEEFSQALTQYLEDKWPVGVPRPRFRRLRRYVSGRRAILLGLIAFLVAITIIIRIEFTRPGVVWDLVKIPARADVIEWIDTQMSTPGIAVSHDGSLIYAGHGMGEHGDSPVGIYDARTLRQVAMIPFPRGKNREGNPHADVVLSADERYLYAVNFYGRSLSRADLKTHEITELDLVTDPKYVNVWAGCLGLAPDGRKLVVTLGSDNRTVDENNDQVSIIDVADNRFKLVGEVALPDEPLGQTAQMAFSPDGRFAYVYTRARKSNVPVLYEIEVAPPGRISRRVRMPGADLRGVAVSGKQRRLFVSDFAGRKIRVFDLESLRPVVDISTAELGPSDLAVYDDRDLGVVVCEQNRTLFCFDTAGGSAVAAVKNLRKYVVDVEFSPDGSRLFVANSRQQPGIGLIDLDELLTRLVFASNRGGESFQVYTAWSDGSAPLRLTSNHATDLFPRWSPDGRRIALVSDRMGLPKVFVMDRDGANTVVLDQTDPVMLDDTGPTIDWSPDGHTIAFIGDERRAIRIVDIATGEIKTLLAGEAGRGYGCHIALSWRSADGSLLFISRSPELGTNQDVFQLDPTSGHVVQVTDNWGTPEYSRSVAASRDTKLVAIVRCDFNYPRKDGLCILRGDDAELAGIASVAAGQYTAVEWYPRGDRLVYSAREGEYAHLYAIDTDGKAPLQLTEGEHDDAFPDVCRILPGDRGDPQNRRNAAPELDGDK